jgi:hypothetical protein
MMAPDLVTETVSMRFESFADDVESEARTL